MNEIIPGKTYKHFKGNIYKVLYIGLNSEKDINDSPEKMVVYESLHDQKVWIRSYENFSSKVDTKKYPNATQEYRFELLD